MKRQFLAIFLVAICTSRVGATDFTFQVTSGDWSTSNNWSPSGHPSSADTVTILNGQTCRVENANEAAFAITVNSGGVLAIKGKDLSIAYSASNTQRVTVNGRIEFSKPSSVTPRLVVNSSVKLGGNGSLQASLFDSLGPAIIEVVGNHDYRLTVESPLLVRGSFSITSPCILDNSSLFLVDEEDDTMLIGPLSTPQYYVQVSGFEGEYRVNKGTLRFGGANLCFYETGENLVLNTDGGTTNVSQYAGTCGIPAELKLLSGLLDFDVDALALNGITFTGGQLRAAPDVEVTIVHYAGY
ncbi:hypothetical protein RAS1_05670 [Phycisphaerae bacterium RAS1]|nr:hypothetical protein RAS1_05670 [Phycisphaerae bacterium RAS1]